MEEEILEQYGTASSKTQSLPLAPPPGDLPANRCLQPPRFTPGYNIPYHTGRGAFHDILRRAVRTEV
eukprot:scaffold3042_cov127-Skeletonema_dohrnii-CCMP3373.AAC.24